MRPRVDGQSGRVVQACLAQVLPERNRCGRAMPSLRYGRREYSATHSGVAALARQATSPAGLGQPRYNNIADRLGTILARLQQFGRGGPPSCWG